MWMGTGRPQWMYNRALTILNLVDLASRSVSISTGVIAAGLPTIAPQLCMVCDQLEAIKRKGTFNQPCIVYGGTFACTLIICCNLYYRSAACTGRADL